MKIADQHTKMVSFFYGISCAKTDLHNKYIVNFKFVQELLIYIDVASYCYYEKERITNVRSLSIFILFQLQSWIKFEIEDEVFAQEFSCEESDFWDCDDEYI